MLELDFLKIATEVADSGEQKFFGSTYHEGDLMITRVFNEVFVVHQGKNVTSEKIDSEESQFFKNPDHGFLEDLYKAAYECRIAV